MHADTTNIALNVHKHPLSTHSYLCTNLELICHSPVVFCRSFSVCTINSTTCPENNVAESRGDRPHCRPQRDRAQGTYVTRLRTDINVDIHARTYRCRYTHAPYIHTCARAHTTCMHEDTVSTTHHDNTSRPHHRLCPLSLCVGQQHREIIFHFR